MFKEKYREITIRHDTALQTYNNLDYQNCCCIKRQIYLVDRTPRRFKKRLQYLFRSDRTEVNRT